MLVNRIKPYLDHLVSLIQCSFIPGHHITNNIIIAQEVIHIIYRKKGRKGFMAIKIDIEEAYDRLRWSFILDTLQFIGFPNAMSSIIMRCIISTTMQMLWNGNTSNSFTSSRGVR